MPVSMERPIRKLLEPVGQMCYKTEELRVRACCTCLPQCHEWCKAGWVKGGRLRIPDHAEMRRTFCRAILIAVGCSFVRGIWAQAVPPLHLVRQLPAELLLPGRSGGQPMRALALRLPRLSAGLRPPAPGVTLMGSSFSLPTCMDGMMHILWTCSMLRGSAELLRQLAHRLCCFKMIGRSQVKPVPCTSFMADNNGSTGSNIKPA